MEINEHTAKKQLAPVFCCAEICRVTPVEAGMRHAAHCTADTACNGLLIAAMQNADSPTAVCILQPAKVSSLIPFTTVATALVAVNETFARFLMISECSTDVGEATLCNCCGVEGPTCTHAGSQRLDCR